MSASKQDGANCGCIVCQLARLASRSGVWLGPGHDPHFRFACEICGNKRCPHHTDHGLTCTGSNEPGQTGSIFA